MILVIHNYLEATNHRCSSLNIAKTIAKHLKDKKHLTMEAFTGLLAKLRYGQKSFKVLVLRISQNVKAVCYSYGIGWPSWKKD